MEYIFGNIIFIWAMGVLFGVQIDGIIKSHRAYKKSVTKLRDIKKDK